MPSSPLVSGMGRFCVQYVLLRMRALGCSRVGAFVASVLSGMESKSKSSLMVFLTTSMRGSNEVKRTSAIIWSLVSAHPPPGSRSNCCNTRMLSTKLTSLFFGIFRMQVFTCRSESLVIYISPLKPKSCWLAG